ncbi:MAG: NADH-quinone oxidoreductase subunit A [Bdellovibrionaceae bacterium]|nr:NADH-quinone oxidoreductase subunit A [Pseudobdellovibrionaceae bacterium]MDW8189370.1 NADH-quinone oxidoreductase subunit A [Pseudobdellovibrionaceae bacterium]
MPLPSVFFLAGFVTLFGFLLLFVASKIGEVVRDRVKSETYECGLPVEEKVDTKISIKFYLTAILFIIFDIEIIFLYPWAVSLKEFLAQGLGWYSLIGVGIFLLIFIFGLWWEIKSKALDWE